MGCVNSKAKTSQDLHPQTTTLQPVNSHSYSPQSINLDTPLNQENYDYHQNNNNINFKSVPQSIGTVGTGVAGAGAAGVAGQPLTEAQRKKAILDMYQIDKEERLPHVPKVNSYNYQTLLVHNPGNGPAPY